MTTNGIDRSGSAGGSGAAVTPVDANVVDAKGDLIVGTADNAVDNLTVGTNEMRLVADSAQTLGLKYVADTTNYAINAKGDLLVGTAADTAAPLTVGANDTIVMADSAQTTGLKWATPSTARTALGLVAAGAGDIWVEKAGDVMTGNLSITKSGNSVLELDSTNAAALVVLNAFTSQQGTVIWQTNAAEKWRLFCQADVANDLVFGRGAGITEVLRLAQTDGVATFAARVILTSGNLSFPATANPNADANTLDDYEEGTWTPSVGGTATYTLQSGTYTKIGRLVHLSMRLTINVIGSGAVGTISGVPFTPGATTAVAVGFWQSSATNYTSVLANIASGSAAINLCATAAAVSNVANPATFFGNGADIFVGGSFII